MSCAIQIINSGGGNDGKWYITGSYAFPITLGVSDIEAGPYTFGPYSNGDQVGTDNEVWVDFSSAAPPPSYPNQIVFTYVLGEGGPEACADPCEACAEFVVTVLDPPVADPSAVSYCASDSTTHNLFAIVGFGCVLPNGYILTYSPGSDEDPGFNMDQGDCALGTYGDFIPSNVAVGVYTFDFTRKNADFDCDDCKTQLEVTIFEPPCIGEAQVAYICRDLMDCP